MIGKTFGLFQLISHWVCFYILFYFLERKDKYRWLAYQKILRLLKFEAWTIVTLESACKYEKIKPSCCLQKNCSWNCGRISRSFYKFLCSRRNKFKKIKIERQHQSLCLPMDLQPYSIGRTLC